MKLRRTRQRTGVEQPGGSSSRRTTGFSLFELVLVLVVIAVLASIGLSRFSGSSRRQGLDAAARRLVADLDLARQNAVASGKSGTVTFDKPAASYSVDGVADLNDRALTYRTALGRDPYAVAISEVNADGAGGSVLTFDGYGRPILSGSATEPLPKVVLGSRAGSIQVSVDPATGRAYVGTTP